MVLFNKFNISKIKKIRNKFIKQISKEIISAVSVFKIVAGGQRQIMPGSPIPFPDTYIHLGESRILDPSEIVIKEHNLQRNDAKCFRRVAGNYTQGKILYKNVILSLWDWWDLT